jgi:hypothetical protein
LDAIVCVAFAMTLIFKGIIFFIHIAIIWQSMDSVIVTDVFARLIPWFAGGDSQAALVESYMVEPAWFTPRPTAPFTERAHYAEFVEPQANCLYSYQQTVMR